MTSRTLGHAAQFASGDTPVRSAASLGFVGELFERSRASRSGATVALIVALSAHALAGVLVPEAHAPRPPLAPPLELEFIAPEPPPPPVIPDTPPELARPEPPLAPARPQATPTPTPPPAAPAAAPAVLTAKEIEPGQAAPDMLDFTSDPTATQLHSGVVALGGKGQRGPRAALPSAAPAPVARPSAGSGQDVVTPLGDLSQRPGLGVDDPCRGYFPSGALDDSAKVAVMLVIKKDGSVKSASLLSESPAGQGFGAAAQACMKRQHFSPALDRDGRAASTAMRVNVRFNR